MMSIKDASLLIEAKIIGVKDNLSTKFHRVIIDSRQIHHGDLFISLYGKHFNSHNFIEEVALKGAVAAVVDTREIRNNSRLLEIHNKTNLPLLCTSNTRLALTKLAANWRKRFTIPIVAVVGSNGKTTVKEMISSIFAKAIGTLYKLSTIGNLNNDIGISLTLLSLRKEHCLAVIEIGINHPGETKFLAQLCSPTISLINNAQREHQEFMHDVNTVAIEHAEILSILPPEGIAIFPSFDKFSTTWNCVTGKRRKLTFFLKKNYSSLELSQNNENIIGQWHNNRQLNVIFSKKKFTVNLSTFGRHNAHNALAAIACSLSLGISIDVICNTLNNFQSLPGRLQRLYTRCKDIQNKNVIVIDDTYNANPDSVLAAIDVLSLERVRPLILVLGDMGEVGIHSMNYYKEIGKYARIKRIDILFTLGIATQQSCQSFYNSTSTSTNYTKLELHFTSYKKLLHKLIKKYNNKATILVKGSRYMHMEYIVNKLIT